MSVQNRSTIGVPRTGLEPRTFIVHRIRTRTGICFGSLTFRHSIDRIRTWAETRYEILSYHSNRSPMRTERRNGQKNASRNRARARCAGTAGAFIQGRVRRPDRYRENKTTRTWEAYTQGLFRVGLRGESSRLGVFYLLVTHQR